MDLLAGHRVAFEFWCVITDPFPALQLLERWLMTEPVVEKYLVHYKTGEPMPAELIAKLQKASTFNQGFSTTEYLASALIDMEFHTVDPEGLDPDAFERETLEAGVQARNAAMSGLRAAAADPSNGEAIKALAGAEAALSGNDPSGVEPVTRSRPGVPDRVRSGRGRGHVPFHGPFRPPSASLRPWNSTGSGLL